MKYMVLILIFIVTVAIGIFMWNGKGAWMVAGYNDLKPEEKVKYNKKEVARGASVSMFGIAAAVIATFLGEYFQKNWLYTVALFVILAGVGITLTLGIIKNVKQEKDT